MTSYLLFFTHDVLVMFVVSYIAVKPSLLLDLETTTAFTYHDHKIGLQNPRRIDICNVRFYQHIYPERSDY